ncbi:uncharacterized protein LOC123262241 [Cotesia glomerata]|uniref:uncharacterized protein LOC123262241 n=1 Tax=Cotesia glomerata TaxID=32391 RepID=UPI001D02AE9E|nr:uncharacterized protein LOC123262241 [Cotesia glomerata]
MEKTMDKKNINTIKSEWKHFLLMEPPIFLLLLANGMTSNVITDLMLFQTCQQVMGENKSNCDILHTNSSSEDAKNLTKIVQPHMSYLLISRSLIKGILPALLILFLGPWSDKYGRKPLIIAGYFVPVCRFIILSVLSSFDVSPWLLLLAYVPTALLGSGLLLATICYISDTTEPDKRAWHLACLQTCVKIGLVIGTFTGPLIFQKLNYTKLFMIATLLCLLSLLYVIFMLPETVKNKSEEKWGNPFDLSLIKQLILTYTKKRDGLNRGLFFSCLLVVSLFRIQAHGNTDISYLFVNAKIGWNVVQYSMFSSISMITSIIGTFVGLKIMRDYLGMSDITEALIGCISGLSAVLCLAFVSKPWHMYLEIGLGMFSGVLLPTVRSLLSKSVPVDDTGNVFTEMILYQTCRHTLVINKTKCDIFHTNTSSNDAQLLQEIVQPQTSYIIMTKSLFENIFPTLLTLFVGPWSDKHGRKPFLVLGCFVPTCKYTILSILSCFDVNPWMFLLSSIPSAFLDCGLVLATNCYVSDITEPDKRATRLTYLQLSAKIGLVIGLLIGPMIFEKIGYMFLFIIATILTSLALFYTIVLVPESVKNKSDKKWGDSFSLSIVRKSIFILIKKTDGIDRSLLWSCLITLSFYKITTDGNNQVLFLFVNAKFGWNITQYSIFRSFTLILLIVGTFSAIKLTKSYMGLTDITAILIGCVSGMLSALSLSFATKTWHMYGQICLGVFRGIVLPSTRSLMSQSTPAKDLGKVFSLATLAERILLLLSSPLYSLTYSCFIFTYPSPVYLLSSGIFFLMIIINSSIKLTKSEKITKQHQTQPNSS